MSSRRSLIDDVLKEPEVSAEKKDFILKRKAMSEKENKYYCCVIQFVNL